MPNPPRHHGHGSRAHRSPSPTVEVDNEVQQSSQHQSRHSRGSRAQRTPSPPINIDDEVQQSLHHHSHVSRAQHSPSPTSEDDDKVQQSRQGPQHHGHGSQTQRTPSQAPTIEVDDEVRHSPSRSLSPQAGSKRQHNTDDDDSENDSNLEETDVHVSKAQKTEKKTTRPKAGDYDEIGKELVLAAANLYRALLASQGAFPNTSKEIELIKKSWKLANAESGVNPLALTPSIVTIVSKFHFRFHVTILLSFLCASRLKLEAHNFGERPKQKRPLLSRLYTALTVDGAKGQLQRTGREPRS